MNKPYQKALDIITQHYGEATTLRSGVKLINHIHEGIRILEHIKADSDTISAYCIHPILQNDQNLSCNYIRDFFRDGINSKTLILTMEYRKVANSYLSIGKKEDVNDIVLPQTRLMLIADKIQNYKDFYLYHLGKHERSNELYEYFHNWFKILNIDFNYFLNPDMSLKF